VVNFTIKDLARLRNNRNRTPEEDAQLAQAETQLTDKLCMGKGVKPKPDYRPFYLRTLRKTN
jgi:hypothetical protein